MAAPPFKARGIVVRKTALGETDLIVTIITEAGTPLRAIAKSGRKPSAGLASRLELFSEVDVLCATGKSLSIIQEARRAKTFLSVGSEPERMSGASIIAEMLQKASHDDLETPILYAAGRAAMQTIGTAPLRSLVAISAAFILKALAYIGLRPELNECVICGSPIETDEKQATVLGMSARDGGLVCEGCRFETAARSTSVHAANFARFFLMTPFSVIAETPCDANASFDVLSFAQELVREHLGSPLHSVDFLLTAGLDFSPSCKEAVDTLQ